MKFETLVKKIEDHRDALKISEAELCRRAGLGRDRIRKIREGHAPKTEAIAAIATALGLESAELLDAYLEDQKSLAQSAQDCLQSVEDNLKVNTREEYISIPAYDLRFSAGPGAIGVTDMPSPTHYNHFRLQFLEQLTPASSENLFLAEVAGESMAPTLYDGDQVLVDQSRTSPEDAIFAMRMQDVLLIKRLTVHPATGQITIGSDNPAHATYDAIDPQDVVIIGRVIWLGRRV